MKKITLLVLLGLLALLATSAYGEGFAKIIMSPGGTLNAGFSVSLFPVDTSLGSRIGYCGSVALGDSCRYRIKVAYKADLSDLATVDSVTIYNATATTRWIKGQFIHMAGTTAKSAAIRADSLGTFDGFMIPCVDFDITNLRVHNTITFGEWDLLLGK